MQIVGFKPNVGVDLFQVILKSTCSEDKVRQAAFAALANSSIEQLTTNLSGVHKEKAEGYVKERAVTISLCVRMINSVGDLRDTLMESLPPFSRASQLFNTAQQALVSLNQLDPRLANAIVASVASYTCCCKTKASKFQKVIDEKRSFLEIRRALIQMELKSLTQDEHQLKLERLRLAIEIWLMNGGLTTIPDLKEQIKKMFAHTPATLKILDEQFAAAKSRVDEMFATRGDVTEKMSALEKILTDALTEYHAVKEQLAASDDYKKYKARKKEVHSHLVELSKFCHLKELENHPKMTNEGRAYLHKKLNITVKPPKMPI